MGASLHGEIKRIMLMLFSVHTMAITREKVAATKHNISAVMRTDPESSELKKLYGKLALWEGVQKMYEEKTKRGMPAGNQKNARNKLVSEILAILEKINKGE